MPLPGMPPQMTGTPPMGAAPMGQKLAQPGNGAQAMAQVRLAIETLQKALPSLPVGSESHKAVLDCVQKLAKVAPASEAQPGIQQTAVNNLQNEQRQNAPMEFLMRALASQGGRAAA